MPSIEGMYFEDFRKLSYYDSNDTNPNLITPTSPLSTK
jgi:hypothetical protein